MCLVKCKLKCGRVFNLYPFVIIFKLLKLCFLFLFAVMHGCLHDYYKIFSLFLLTTFLFATLLLLFMLIQLCWTGWLQFVVISQHLVLPTCHCFLAVHRPVLMIRYGFCNYGAFFSLQFDICSVICCFMALCSFWRSIFKKNLLTAAG